MLHFIVLFVITAPYLWSYGSDLGPSCDLTVCAVQLCNGTGNPNFGDCLCSASTPGLDIVDCLQKNCQRNSDYWSQISDLDGCCGTFSLRRLTDFKDAYAHSMDIVRNYTADASIPITAISQCSGFANGSLAPTGVDSISTTTVGASTSLVATGVPPIATGVSMSHANNGRELANLCRVVSFSVLFGTWLLEFM
jgi:hypothetical protein